MKDKTMKILMLNTPFLPKFTRASRSPAVAKSNTLYYPIWLAYATGVLEKEGYEVKLIDAPAMEWDKEKVYDFAKSYSPDLVVVDTTTPSIYSDEDIGDNLKNISGAFTVLVGTHASALPKQVLEETSNIDAIAIGEYDYTIRDLARCLDLGLNWKRVQGIAYQEGNEIIVTSKREKIKDIDNIPFVSRIYKKHLYPYLDRYFYGANRYPVITIVSGRGCPHQCSYCVYPQVMFGHEYRVRSVSNLVDELSYIKKEFPQVKEIFLEDDTLTINKKRVIEVCKEIKRRKLKIVWSTNSRAQVDFETLKEMKAAGCRLLCVGFESANQNILNNISKKLRVEEIYEFVKNTKKAGILIHGCFLVGSEGETLDTLEETLKMAKKLNTDTAQFYPLMVYPGTKAYDWAKRNNYLTTERYNEWLTSEGLHNCVVSTSEISSSELVRWTDKARREFYLNPNYIMRKLIQSFKHPSEFKRLLRGFKSLSRFLFKK
jgi:anaerobic magnesium-protoporphyrin IX monomethyl ester cyclase